MNSKGMAYSESLQQIEAIKARKTNSAQPKFWFDQNVSGLSKDGKQRLKELEEEAADMTSARHVDKKQLRCLQKLKKMKMIVPDFYRQNLGQKQLFRRMQEFCIEHDIPESVAVRLIPSFLSFIQTGYMKPVLLIGEAGCGKTTALKLLVEWILKIPVEKVNVTLESRGRGLSGTDGSYQSASYGIPARVAFKSNNLLYSLIFDEIDKSADHSDRTSLDEELLPLTDKSGGEVYDQYLENTMVLQHCPIFFTGNDLEKVNPILADRLEIIHFPDADVPRIKSILHKYAQKRMLELGYHQFIHLDYSLLDEFISDLAVNYKIHSLRKHEDMLDNALDKAFLAAMKQESDDIVPVSREILSEAEMEIIAESTSDNSRRRIGFV